METKKFDSYKFYCDTPRELEQEESRRLPGRDYEDVMSSLDNGDYRAEFYSWCFGSGKESAYDGRTIYLFSSYYEQYDGWEEPVEVGCGFQVDVLGYSFFRDLETGEWSSMYISFTPDSELQRKLENVYLLSGPRECYPKDSSSRPMTWDEAYDYKKRFLVRTRTAVAMDDGSLLEKLESEVVLDGFEFCEFCKYFREAKDSLKESSPGWFHLLSFKEELTEELWNGVGDLVCATDSDREDHSLQRGFYLDVFADDLISPRRDDSRKTYLDKIQ